MEGRQKGELYQVCPAAGISIRFVLVIDNNFRHALREYNIHKKLDHPVSQEFD